MQRLTEAEKIQSATSLLYFVLEGRRSVNGKSAMNVDGRLIVDLAEKARLIEIRDSNEGFPFISQDSQCSSTMSFRRKLVERGHLLPLIPELRG